MKKDKMSNEIQSLQNNSDYAIVDNVFSNPKFVRKISIKETKAINEIYTPKLFIEIVSRLKPESLEHLKNNENLVLDLNIKDFLKNIEVNEKHGYGYLVDVIDMLQTTQLKWTEDKKDISTTIISKYTHEKGSGKIDLYVDSELAKRLLSVKSVENFSFLKENFFKLKTSQAIKLYQFFKSWQNKGVYQTDLLRFKEQFGYNTSGYNDFNKFKNRVLEPAKAEINKKTDIIVTYETTGDNLESLRPRVRGLIFYITSKEKTKQLPSGERHQTPQPKDEKTHISNLIKAVAPQEQTVQPQKIQVEDQPSHAQIIELGEKLKLNNIQVQTIMDELKGNHIRTFEVLQGCINESKVKTINSNFAYIIGSITTLGVGLWEAEKEKTKKREAEKLEKQKQAIIQKIQTEYQERKKTQFLKIYEKASDQEKAELLEHIRETKTIESLGVKRNYYINKETQKLNEGGEVLAGSILAEQKNTGIEVRQNKYRNEVFEKYGYTIGYDQDDQVIILGIFENIEPQPTPPPSIEANEPTAEPPKKAEVIRPQEQKSKPKAKRHPQKATKKQIPPTPPKLETNKEQEEQGKSKGLIGSLLDKFKW